MSIVLNIWALVSIVLVLTLNYVVFLFVCFFVLVFFFFFFFFFFLISRVMLLGSHTPFVFNNRPFCCMGYIDLYFHFSVIVLYVMSGAALGENITVSHG